jgi:hypothetical protein
VPCSSGARLAATHRHAQNAQASEQHRDGRRFRYRGRQRCANSDVVEREFWSNVPAALKLPKLNAPPVADVMTTTDGPYGMSSASANVRTIAPDKSRLVRGLLDRQDTSLTVSQIRHDHIT